VWDWIHNHNEIIILALTVIGVAIAWFQLKKKDPSSTSNSPSLNHSPVERSTIITGSNNQIVIGNPPTEPRRAEPSKIEYPIPNLVYAGAKRKWVFISPSQDEGICDPRTENQRTKSVEAFLLKFENRKAGIDGKIGHALNVIAKMKFRHKNGVRERDIDYGVWLNSSCNSTEIGIGDTRELVLLCVLDKDIVTFEDRRSGNRVLGYAGFTYIQEGDAEDYERVDITLIDQNSQASLSIKLRVWREGGSFFSTEL
jgi:hypothetical protein